MRFEAINNPRKDNGDFGDASCHICKTYSGAYIKINDSIICKGCLLAFVDVIDKTILNYTVRKGKLLHGR
jgi:hypothetical protein